MKSHTCYNYVFLDLYSLKQMLNVCEDYAKSIIFYLMLLRVS